MPHGGGIAVERQDGFIALGFAVGGHLHLVAEDYGMPEEIFVGNRKGDLPGASFLTEEMFLEIRDRALAIMKADAEEAGFGSWLGD